MAHSRATMLFPRPRKNHHPMDKHPRRQPFRLLHSAAFVLLSIFFITRITFRVSPFNRETDQLLIQQAATMMIPQEKDKNAIVEKRKITVPNVPPVPTVPQHYPRLILGHSTGHTASYSIHNAITLPGCPWSRQDKTKLEMENLDNNTISSINIHLDSQSTRPLLLMPKFEWTGPGERRWKHGWLNETSSERSCKLTEKHLFRKLFEYIHRVQTPDNTTQSTVHHKKTKSKNDEIIDMSNTIFMDMGHFHNRGHVLECLAYMLQQKLTLIRIRRNRHQIANSFAAKFETPCIRDHEHIVLPPPPNNTRGRRKRIAPGLAICPRSGEKVGPVYLKVPGGDTVWDDILTPFQRFLWYADEMEYRWNMLRKYFNENKSQFQSPTFLEVTWSTPDQLFQGTNHVRTSLGCSPLPRIPMSHNHTRTQVQAINCTEYIVQDWEYQQIMQYDIATRTILLGQPGLPQFLDSDKCAESREELEAFVLTHMPPSLKA